MRERKMKNESENGEGWPAMVPYIGQKSDFPSVIHAMVESFDFLQKPPSSFFN